MRPLIISLAEIWQLSVKTNTAVKERCKKELLLLHIQELKIFLARRGVSDKEKLAARVLSEQKTLTRKATEGGVSEMFPP